MVLSSVSGKSHSCHSLQQALCAPCLAGDQRYHVNEFVVQGVSLIAFIEHQQPRNTGSVYAKMLVLLFLGAWLALSAPSSSGGLGASRQLSSPGSAGLHTKAPQGFKSTFWTPAQLNTCSTMFPSQPTAHMKDLNDLTESLKILWQIQDLNPKLPNWWPVPSLQPFCLDQWKVGMLFS